jgi:sigma-54 specific flagellar transcriptional regulator A
MLETFKKYNWPGNIRELSNISARLTTLYPGKKNIQVVDINQNMLPLKLRNNLDSCHLEDTPSNPVEELISLAQGNEMSGTTEKVTKNEDSKTDSERSLKERIAAFERKLIKDAILKTNGNVTKAAKLLNVQRTTLVEKINKHSIDSA